MSKTKLRKLLLIVGMLALGVFVIYVLYTSTQSNLQSRNQSVNAQVPAETSHFLQADGKNLVYKGQPVILKGTNFDNIGALGAKIAGEDIGTGKLSDIYFNNEDYAELYKQGANHARLGLSFNWYKDDTSPGKATFFQKMDEQVAFAKKNNVWIIFNMFTTPGYCYEGYSNHCGFWNNAGEQSELLEFWKAMVNRYKNEPAVAGYDLLNEPFPPTYNCGDWFKIAGNMYTQLSAISPNQLFFIEACADPGNDLKYGNPPKGKNIVYEVHEYSPMDASHDNFSPGTVYPGYSEEWYGRCYYNKETFKGVIRSGDPSSCSSADVREHYGINWANQNNVPIYLGEWGATSRLNGYIQYTKDKAELYKEWGVNHAHYTWKHQTVKTGGDHQWGIYPAPNVYDNDPTIPPLTLDDPEKLAAVKIAWEGAVRPNFAGGTIVSPTNPPVVTAGATVAVSPTKQPTVTPSKTPTPALSGMPRATNTNTPGRPRMTNTNTPSPTRVPTAVPTSVQAQKKFYRAINFNGPAFTYNGVTWEDGVKPANVTYLKWFHVDNNTALVPAVTDAGFASMLRSRVYYVLPDNPIGTKVTVTNVPNGTYEVILYIWENDSWNEQFELSVNNKLVGTYQTGSKGQWQKLGPFTATVTDGNVIVAARKGNVAFSGMEIWRVK